MIRRISREEFYRDGAEILRAVDRGTVIEIIDGERVLATLSPPASEKSAPSGLWPARRRGGFGNDSGVRPSLPTAVMLDQLRGER
ncbi:MAG: hypothetical protein M9938_08435 [Solirubrobacterales bacterium]|nr:hypothetical protein [Solirubrobacterales bacterium]